ncbi:MAG: anaerobic carbon-monoxide dehydrogenase catalytic subunit [Peptococcaceae bacterium]|nr:anaerobic carbon-monoxide dehydrogenase catalytic subunit [Peptococcaceae bacterium]
MPRFSDLDFTARSSSVPRVEEPKNRERTVDPAALEMLKVAQEHGVYTAYDRAVAQQPQCQFGYKGICCRICIQGPCRIKADDGPASRGMCGADANTIVARNLVRFIAGGTSSHSDHGRHIARTLLHLADGEAPDYKIADPAKLQAVAKRIGITTEGKTDIEIAKEVAIEALDDYGRYGDQTCTFLTTTITKGRQDKFKATNVGPVAIDRSVVQLLAQTAMGVDSDPVNIIFGGLKASLADYTGMHIATDISDILFGTPKPLVSEANLGVLEEDKINIAVHGHNPLVSEMVVSAAHKLESEAIAAGAKGINIVGLCCTGHELLMRKGVYIATNQSSQELAIMTGVLDSMVLDIQCMMPSVTTAAECFHTRIITTNEIAKFPGAIHYPFDETTAMEDAMAIVRLSIDNFKNRDLNKIHIPQHKNKVVAGFSLEAMLDLFAAINPDRPISVLTDAILSGEIKGVCLLAGCNNLKQFQDKSHLTIMKELAANDVLMVATGCSAGAAAKAGLMAPDAVDKYAGPGLKAFTKRVEAANKLTTGGLPLVFHMGACVDNTRAADLVTAMANELGVDVPKVPFVASAPEATHEKSISIGTWAVTMGLPVHVGTMPPLEGSDLVYGVATQIAHDVFGGHFILEMDSEVAAKKLINALEYRSWKLGVHRDAAEKYATSLAQGY